MGVIRTNYLLQQHPALGFVVRRKSSMTTNQTEDILADDEYRVNMYTATSKNQWAQIESMNVGESDVRWEFEVPTGCFQVSEVQHLSAFPGEKEVLVVPYSGLRIISKVASGGKVTVRAAISRDSRNTSLEVPTILC